MTRRLAYLPFVLAFAVLALSTAGWAQPDNRLDPAAEVDRLTQQLDDAVAQYEAGETDAAVESMKQLFMAFEASTYDRKLSTRDHGFYLQLERAILTLEGAMANGADVSDVQSRADRIESLFEEGLQKLNNPLSRVGAFLQSLVIIVREGLEAILILGAVLLVLRRTSQSEHVRAVYAGAGLGILASLGIAAVLVTLLQHLPASQALIEGASMLLAVPVLFAVSHWLIAMAHIRNWNAHIQSWIRTASQSGRSWALVSVAFLAVFREGAETVLFYQALSASVTGAVGAIVLGFVLGTALLIVAWALMRKFGIKIPLRPFFIGTSAFLYLMAFRFAGTGILELQEAGVIGITTIIGFPEGSWLQGLLQIYPYWEPLVAQSALTLALVAGVIYTFRDRLSAIGGVRRRKQESSA